MKYLRNIFALLSVLLCFACCQKAGAILRIERNYLVQNVNSFGTTVKIPVRATGDYAATVSADAASWCHASVSGVFITLTVDPLEQGGERSSVVTVSSAGCHNVEISVKQSPVVIVDEPSEIILSGSLKSFSLRIISGAPLQFSYPSWIHPVDDLWVPGEKLYSFEADEIRDPDLDSRNGVFTVKSTKVEFKREIPVTQISFNNSAVKTLKDLWGTNIFGSSPLDLKSDRYSLLMDIEAMCNNLSRDEFQSYLAMQDAAAKREEENKDILALYRYAFDHVLSELQSTKVENGTAVIWSLYNAGFIVKTPSVTFGLDVNHRYAVELEPYLDFMCVSHSDNDHIDNALMAAMDRAGKPVLSNFHTANPYCSTVSTTYNIGDITIRTAITDENDDEPNCMTVHRIKCGADTGGFEIIHTGDSDYKKIQLAACLDGTATNVLILRYGGPREVSAVGREKGQVIPDYVLFSHVEELRHYPTTSPMRAAISTSINNMKTNFYGSVAQNKCYLPFWGEKMVWKNGKLQ